MLQLICNIPRENKAYIMAKISLYKDQGKIIRDKSREYKLRKAISIKKKEQKQKKRGN